jgi:transcriptional regulator with PAS, ATPase and Fis domain
VRIIAATNQNLEDAVRERRFREDLFYRLNVIPIKVPPLRSREDDVPLLLNFFLKRSNDGNNRNVEGFSQEAMTMLCDYDWPGNVRELENVMERSVILKGAGLIDVADLPDKIVKRPVQFQAQKIVIPETG